MSIVNNFRPSRVYYKSTNNSGQTLARQIFEINGYPVPFKFHPMTLRSSLAKKARPRAQLTATHAAKLGLPMIDENASEVTKIIFPNGRVNYVLLARK